MIYHYTSPEAFINIVKHEGINLRFSRYDCLNDLQEGFEAVQIQKRLCKRMVSIEPESKKLLNEISKIVPTFKMNIMPRSVRSSGLTCSITKHNVETTPYICCFSKLPDSLPLWNYYVKGSRYEGYNIGIDLSKAEFDVLDNTMKPIENPGSKSVLLEVIYSKKEKENIIQKEINKLLKDPKDFSELIKKYQAMMDQWSISFKKQSFQHEAEVRLVCFIPKETINDFNINKCALKFRTSHGLLVPYIDINFDNKEILKKTIIGPLVEKNIAENTLKMYLEENGYTKVNVNSSSIKIRY